MCVCVSKAENVFIIKITEGEVSLCELVDTYLYSQKCRSDFKQMLPL